VGWWFPGFSDILLPGEVEGWLPVDVDTWIGLEWVGVAALSGVGVYCYISHTSPYPSMIAMDAQLGTGA
jgi:hypothetical protein